mmetsp:Transcript_81105/g.229727  ORF Transcript_81105/g.229727 Transcript_81105/m.229727 type:complete len:400 (-) Transcript_81105:90-1289(-)|eukprot:CAMPEP_0168399090 /NCGR_PEP_ID=MMETSP0228-20121227/21912_1 /TAXON_ID=133427 /ORGANISM="Protoceratium reticulatum, Strain CCCM 535 (=CCMP 1889)" /LENGTH=399 /DNA_ID=CAMNT_0008412607 /DNA_START=1 /DNA_END=1196 /DNA_ORIENTATION=+
MAWLVATSLAAAAGTASAWWDNGHMLAAQVARQSLQAEEAERLDALLGEWASDFPGASDLVTAAVWPDQIKCRKRSPTCRKQLPDAMNEFDSWHFTNRPFNPDGLPLPSTLTTGYNKEPSVTWSLAQAMQTFSSSKTRFAFNLMLRFTVHLVGDLHQPLHVAEGFFNDTRLGEHPTGDEGGNKVKIEGPPGLEVTNLHQFWDSAGGLYQWNWPLSDQHKADLAQNATELMRSIPSSSLPLYDGSAVASCHRDGCEPVFAKWVNETFAQAVENAYGHGLAANAVPPPEYVANARRVSQQQIVLAGYRLADVLRVALAHMPSPQAVAPGHAGPAAGQAAAAPGGSVAGLVLAAACAVLVLSAMVLLLALRTLKVRRGVLAQQKEQLLAEAEQRAVRAAALP